MDLTGPRRVFLWLRVLTCAAAFTTVVGGHESEVFRVVRVKGHLVHYREVVPESLDHSTVIRHFRDGEILLADRVGIGIGPDGTGTGKWLHVRDLLTDRCGWVSSSYVVEIPGAVIAEEREHRHSPELAAPPSPRAPEVVPLNPMTPQSPAPAVAPSPATPQQPRNVFDWLQVLANIATTLSLLATLLLSERLTAMWWSRRPCSATFTASAAGSASSTNSNGPNFVYGSTNGRPWRIRIR